MWVAAAGWDENSIRLLCRRPNGIANMAHTIELNRKGQTDGWMMATTTTATCLIWPTIIYYHLIDIDPIIWFARAGVPNADRISKLYHL